MFVVSGIDEKLERVTWRRFASGLYQPLGLKIVKGEIFVTCRDGIWRLKANAAKNGCFQRVRFTGAVPRMPIELRVKKDGIELRFACTLDTQAARNADNWAIEQWRYVWSSAYGSPELSTEGGDEKPGEVGKDGHPEFSKEQASQRTHDPVTVKSVAIGTDDRTVFLEIPDLKPVMQMAIKYDLMTADGLELRGEVVNTIHALGAE